MSEQIETLPQLARLVAYLTNATVYLLRREEQRLTRLGEERADEPSLVLSVHEELSRVRELLGQITDEAQEIAAEDG